MNLSITRLATLSLSLLLLTSCASEAEPAGQPAEPGSRQPAAARPVEQSTASPRLVLTHDGGLSVLDAGSLELLAEIPLEGFLRLSNAGDGRHLAVAAAGGFHLLDTGSWSETHGDHAHHYTADPALTGGVLEAVKPGHVVAAAGRTAFFDDDSGAVTLLGTAGLGEMQPDAEEVLLPGAHHGVAVPLRGQGLIASRGTGSGTTGAAVLDENGAEVLVSNDCPGLHGTAEAEGSVVFGCEDGMLVYRDGGFRKVPSPDAYGRMGNQAGSAESPVVLADYKSAPGAGLERPETVALVDTASAGLRLVDLGTSYTFRSLGRGPAGEAVVLGTDGALHVVDAATGTLLSRIPVLEPWEEPEDWQQPRPALHIVGGTAYVTDPYASRLLAVDLGAGKVLRSAELAQVPGEISSAR